MSKYKIKYILKSLFNYFKRPKEKSIFNDKKGWTKIENKSNGPLSWTEYTDHDGFVFKIYNSIMNPGFSGATMTYKKEK